MAECFFHTGRPAVARCKQCGRPLCSECRIITDIRNTFPIMNTSFNLLSEHADCRIEELQNCRI